jgi:4-coumarate--CoA ligase
VFAFSEFGFIPNEKGASKFIIVPFFHAYGFLTGLSSLYYSRKIVFLKKFEENIFLQTIEKYRITFLSLVPPIMVQLAKSTLIDKYDLSSVKYLVCGAAPLCKDTEETLRRRFASFTLI